MQPIYSHLGDSWRKQKLNLKQNWLLLCAVRFLIRSTQRHLAAVSGGRRRRHRPGDGASESWRNSLLHIIPTCLCIFLFKKKNLKKYDFFMIFKKKTILKQFKQPFLLEKNI